MLRAAGTPKIQDAFRFYLWAVLAGKWALPPRGHKKVWILKPPSKGVNILIYCYLEDVFQKAMLNQKNCLIFGVMGPFTYYVITFCLFLDPPSVIKFGIG